MKNICFFISSFNEVGGTERVTSVIANEFQKLAGYQVHIVSLHCGIQPFFVLDDNVHIDQLFDNKLRGLTNFPKIMYCLRNYLKLHNIDTLIVVESILSIYSLPASLGLNIHHVCWEHFNYNIDLGKSTRRLARRLAARFSDDIVTLTERDKSMWLSRGNIKAKVTAIPNPITIDLPENINISNNKTFLAVGRLTNQKGFDLLLQSWALITDKHPDWRLRIVGDGEDKDILEHMRMDLGIENTTKLIDKTSHISDEYQKASFFVMSSRFEGLPLVLIEAQAYGLPIISFDCDTGPSEIISNNINGWLCEPLNVKQLSQAMLYAIDMSEDNEKYVKFCELSRVNAKRFTLDKVLFKWGEILECK
ncbi:glycosyltransferase family 4 protein [Escherichia coli]|uniref:glycosyltransferase family 4 protein n=2 Tax=Escherichia coli TaxID=562 RepID=UPI000DA53289|nr:glycosyltransferase family 4 protein [Escherichia coli]MBY7175651.1 glycosyltransferase family 4 protein [Escherichia coli]MBY7184846.1 glycosyltransferase family 4 protein [Escherichia coli]MBY7212385.1 glycosyltransferase family 4 protein [Escherichia coli]MBY7371312.1 glycosyltransferase family 4 protein [Escherichia coli]MBY7442528.1 glycosyltransferase family 4 protein [Escherichia coli]